jgi:hypothetical protein
MWLAMKTSSFYKIKGYFMEKSKYEGEVLQFEVIQHHCELEDLVVVYQAHEYIFMGICEGLLQGNLEVPKEVMIIVFRYLESSGREVSSPKP